jgi:hypothetical protein
MMQCAWTRKEDKVPEKGSAHLKEDKVPEKESAHLKGDKYLKRGQRT